MVDRRKTFFKYWLIALAFVLPTLAHAATDTHEFRLANGLKLIVKEDHRAPTVVNMVWYRAGSVDEQNGTTGVAHVLEHMMFKGTKELKPGEFSKRVAELGGRSNAFTSRDYTAYHEQVERSRLERVMALEADRMQNLIMDPAEFSKEIRVVMEERRLRTEDKPLSLLREALFATAFVVSPYRHPVVGWMDDLQNMTAADALAWYQRWYAPNNAVVVIAGDVDPQQVLKLAEKYFGAIPPKTLPKTKPQQEPAQIGIRRVNIKAPAENPFLMMAYKVPRLLDVEKDEDPYALELLAAVLDGYDNARLPATLVRTDRIANSVNAGYAGVGRGPALFMLSGAPAKDSNVEKLEAALRAGLQKIAKEGVSNEELKRVKAQVIAGQIYKRDSVYGQAMEIGSVEMAGISHKLSDRMIERLSTITPQQVQAVAQKYFSDDQLTVATLTPLPLSAQPERAPEVPGLRH
ncbi:MAG: insulinase family protein [Oxalobacteraceae bacterium]|nr:insulinase family protein [Oxalobacteraceae bacterium]